MKKKIYLLILVAVCCILTACGAKSFTVTFDSQGGSLVPSQTVEKGKVASKPTDPQKDGNAFIGWFLGENEYTFETPVTSNITLTAKWEEVKNTFTVTFKDGDEKIETQTVTEGQTASKPTAPTKEGFTFTGWYLEEVLLN